MSKIRILCLVIVVLVSGFFVMTAKAAYKDNYVNVNILKVVGKTIVVGNNCTAIFAETSPERAVSILFGLENYINQRPNTHDSFAQVLKSFGIKVKRVDINSFDGRFYYSDIVLQNNKKQLKLDIMPSDAIALALRTNAEIYINETFLKESGQNIC